MAMSVPHVQQVQRIRIARDMALDDRAILRRAIEVAGQYSARAADELNNALADLDSAVEHLNRALRLTDPTSRDPLVRRADENRTPAES